jgi:ribokinase
MPRLLNLGSLNIDLVYRIPHIVRPGETLASTSFLRGPGGKGLNQSLAAARAGASVAHAGRIGPDGAFLCELLAADGVDTSRTPTLPDTPTGHAIIQVADSGENSIVLFAGANHALAPADLPALFDGFGAGDWFLTQNETTCVPDALRAAASRGLRVAFNPAPMSPAVRTYPLDAVTLLIVNETEAAELSGHPEPAAAMRALQSLLPQTDIVITLGADGAWFAGPSGEHRATPPRLHPIDTTAAGDTFIGYLLAGLMRGDAPLAALTLACRAAALSTTRPGAASSIPTVVEVCLLPER